MTIRELIELLEKYPPETSVLTWDDLQQENVPVTEEALSISTEGCLYIG